jgi:hypothetical protein
MKNWLLIAGVVVCLAAVSAGGQTPAAGTWFGETPPGSTAVIFSPGFASTHHHDDMFPVFSPDGREAILRIVGKAGGKMIAVLYITRTDESGAWGVPEPLPFLTRHMNGGASFTPDGKRIYFSTRRPLPGEDPADARSRLWYADRTDDGWSEATLVDTPVNRYDLNGGCFLADDGSLYASFVAPDKEKHDIYELKPVGNGYPEYHPVPGNVNSPDMEVVPFVNAREGYMLFTAVTGDGMRIKLSVLGNDGSWSTPEVVDELTGPEAKFVRVSADGNYLFFVSHKKTDQSNPQAIWSIDAFDEPAMEQNADVYWMDAGFLARRAGERRVRNAVVDYYIKGLETREFSLIESICLPGALLQGSRATGELRTTDLPTWSKRFTPGRPPFESLSWEISKVDVAGGAAQVRIDFVVNGDTPVTDFLNLVRVEGRWRITNMIDY